MKFFAKEFLLRKLSLRKLGLRKLGIRGYGWGLLFILVGCQGGTDNLGNGGADEDSSITSSLESSSARILITEVYAPSPMETVVEIYIQDGGVQDTNENAAFSSPSIGLDQIGLRSPAKRPGESLAYRDAYHFNFDRFPGAAFSSLYEGNFYVLIFTNSRNFGLPREYISSAWVDNDEFVIPAITDDCLEMELTLLNDEGTEERQDYIRAGVGCEGNITDVSWDSAGGPLSVPGGVESLTRRIHEKRVETGFIQTLNVFQASEWEIAMTSTPAYPPDAACMITTGMLDADADGIVDCLEVNGETYFGMPLYEWGARPGWTDIFVEMDYMACEVTGDLRSQPDRDVAMRIEEQFSKYESVDGVPFRLHVDVGDLFGERLNSGFNLGGGNSIISDPSEREDYWGINLSSEDGLEGIDIYYSIKRKHFSPARKQLFHYMLLAETTAPDGGPGAIAGIAELNGNDSLITLGGGSLRSVGLNNYPNCDINDPIADNLLTEVAKNFYQNNQAITVLHELGHNLTLSHGGGITDDNNFKPNYFSIMNYLYGGHGPPSSQDSPEVITKHVRDAYYHWVYGEANRDCFQPGRIDFTIRGSNFTGINSSGIRLFNEPQELKLFFTGLDEFHLDYSSGLNGGLRERGINENNWFDIGNVGGTTTPMILDFNCDGQLSANIGESDINLDENTGLSILEDHDDVSAMRSFFTNPFQAAVSSRLQEGSSEAREGGFIYPVQKIFNDRQPVISLQEERAFRVHGHEAFSKFNLHDGHSSHHLHDGHSSHHLHDGHSSH